MEVMASLDKFLQEESSIGQEKIAQDILVVPVSTVASKFAFSITGNIVSHRNRLHSNTVEALVCLRNWKWVDIKGIGLGYGSSIYDDSDAEDQEEIED
ncbi:hypothetical protein Patl1_02021 [Pistacia atlantica]|uniref:Uncharacterized protein n=1 Tax=Pistacia atlantica TaxID=434234 RepID=A0ACC1C885_9ROSI|nr:hypothetical protein Patl1_02021 [Pistacia atlantica]